MNYTIILIAVGAPTPSWRELDDDVMQNSFIIADSLEAAKVESGDVIHSKVTWHNTIHESEAEFYCISLITYHSFWYFQATVAGEIGEVIAGKHKVPKDKTIIFKPLGRVTQINEQWEVLFYE